MSSLTPFEQGIVVGILVGEGSFGGDGRQPQITLRMHTRHAALFAWLIRAVCADQAVRALRTRRAKLLPVDGPGVRGSWRTSCRCWRRAWAPEWDAYAAGRLAEMCERYADFIGRARGRAEPRGAPARATTRRLEELADRHNLTDSQFGELPPLEVLASDAHAPSTVTAPRRAVDVHVATAGRARGCPSLGAAARIADVGSGARFPACRWRSPPPRDRVLLESSARRCAFIERAASAAGVRNAAVVAGRAEAWAPGAGSRTSSRRGQSRHWPCCASTRRRSCAGRGARRVAGHRDREAEAAAERAAAELGLESRAAVRSEPYPGSQEHHLHVYVKVRPTPARFPRRPGIASKRPLGVSS